MEGRKKKKKKCKLDIFHEYKSGEISEARSSFVSKSDKNVIWSWTGQLNGGRYCDSILRTVGELELVGDSEL